MVDVNVNGFGGLAEVLKRAEKDLDASMAPAMLEAADEAAGAISEYLRERTAGTGTLARSFAPTFLEQNSGRITTAALSSAPYAGVMDRPSTTIVPRIRKYLAIPLGKQPPGASPRDFAHLKNFIFWHSKKGNFLAGFVHGRGKNRKLEPKFALKKSVIQYGIGYIKGAWERENQNVTRIIADAAERLITHG